MFVIFKRYMKSHPTLKKVPNIQNFSERNYRYKNILYILIFFDLLIFLLHILWFPSEIYMCFTIYIFVSLLQVSSFLAHHTRVSMFANI